jgi:hypothetical protein
LVRGYRGQGIRLGRLGRQRTDIITGILSLCFLIIYAGRHSAAVPFTAQSGLGEVGRQTFETFEDSAI